MEIGKAFLRYPSVPQQATFKYVHIIGEWHAKAREKGWGYSYKTEKVSGVLKRFISKM